MACRLMRNRATSRLYDNPNAFEAGGPRSASWPATRRHRHRPRRVAPSERSRCRNRIGRLPEDGGAARLLPPPDQVLTVFERGLVAFPTDQTRHKMNADRVQNYRAARTTRVRIELTNRQFAALRRAAEEAGFPTVAEYVRAMLVDYVDLRRWERTDDRTRKAVVRTLRDRRC